MRKKAPFASALPSRSKRTQSTALTRKRPQHSKLAIGSPDTNCFSPNTSKKTTMMKPAFASAALLLSMVAAVVPSFAISAVIKPGEVWLDDRGKQIQAHGGGIT